jgi:hypothetical protein
MVVLHYDAVVVLILAAERHIVDCLLLQLLKIYAMLLDGKHQEAADAAGYAHPCQFSN